jgi:hypothetical protein
MEEKIATTITTTTTTTTTTAANPAIAQAGDNEIQATSGDGFYEEGLRSGAIIFYGSRFIYPGISMLIGGLVDVGGFWRRGTST